MIKHLVRLVDSNKRLLGRWSGVEQASLAKANMWSTQTGLGLNIPIVMLSLILSPGFLMSGSAKTAQNSGAPEWAGTEMRKATALYSWDHPE
jgi:hypothetical protein